MKIQKAVSDSSRTNQLKILAKPEVVFRQLYSYLYQNGKGIESFSIEDKDWYKKEDSKKPNFYEQRHLKIKQQVRERLLQYDIEVKLSDIQYFLSGKTVFFLSPNKNHSGWEKTFCTKKSARERIFNLVFKFHMLSEIMDTETINGFEKLLLLHTANLTKKKDALLVWGQSVYVNFNRHNVLTLTLTRQSKAFSVEKDNYETQDGDDLGEILLYKHKKYRYQTDRDARRGNSISFMKFEGEKNYEKFKTTQVYHYQNLMTRLEAFLKDCNISFETLPFQTKHYIENPFIKNIATVPSIEIINNMGDDLKAADKLFLEKLLQHQGVSSVAFFNSGKTISKYEQIEIDKEKLDEKETEDTCWQITEQYTWSKIKLSPTKNYLVLNKQLEEEAGSIAYKRKDGLWYLSPKNKEDQATDFYSKLKREYNYLENGQFFSLQGMNVPKYNSISSTKKDAPWSILTYPDPDSNFKSNKKKIQALYDTTKDFREGKSWSVEEILYRCVIEYKTDNWNELCKLGSRNKTISIKITSPFKKVLIEMGIKNWVKESLNNPKLGLPIGKQRFCKQVFFAIYTRSPRKGQHKAVAVKFHYENGHLYIENVERDLRKIKRQFPFLRKRKNTDELIGEQQYYVDENKKEYISCYTNDYYTPSLIGREDIIQQLRNNKLIINRGATIARGGSKLFPLVSYYNGAIKPAKTKDMICLDLENEAFIQYYVPPVQGLDRNIKKGFRVYHLIGKNGSNVMSTSDLIEHPLTALHFSTLTQNVLRISNNSQSSLIQKIARVLIEN